MRDDETTIDDLKGLVRRFVAERDWQQFHNPKNLAMSIAIEAAELMEHFQWLTLDEARCPAADDQGDNVADEMADVLAYLLALANTLDIDLASATEAKMAKNREKYPTDFYQGNYKRQPDA